MSASTSDAAVERGLKSVPAAHLAGVDRAEVLHGAQVTLKAVEQQEKRILVDWAYVKRAVTRGVGVAMLFTAAAALAGGTAAIGPSLRAMGIILRAEAGPAALAEFRNFVRGKHGDDAANKIAPPQTAKA